MRSPALAEAVRELEPPSEHADLVEALRVRDHFEAKLAIGIAAFDEAAMWKLDSATSVVAWLRAQGLAPGDAIALAKAARRAAEVPALSDAWLDGRLRGGQVKAIVANVTDKTSELFAEHAPELIPALVGLGVQETARAMQVWQARAEALLADGEPPGAPALAPTRRRPSPAAPRSRVRSTPTRGQTSGPHCKQPRPTTTRRSVPARRPSGGPMR